MLSTSSMGTLGWIASMILLDERQVRVQVVKFRRMLMFTRKATDSEACRTMRITTEMSALRHFGHALSMWDQDTPGNSETHLSHVHLNGQRY
jgi:hypothetical protein